jgi:hypothetical protein
VKNLSLNLDDTWLLHSVFLTLSSMATKDTAGNTVAYRVARNIATLTPSIEASRDQYQKLIASRIEDLKAKCDPVPEEQIAIVREEVAKTLIGEKEEIRLRSLPWAGLRWAEMGDREKAVLIRFELVDEPTESAEAPQPTCGPTTPH